MAEGGAGRPSHDLCATSGWPGVVAQSSHKDPVVQLTSETKKPNRILQNYWGFLSLNFLGQVVHCGPRLINKHLTRGRKWSLFSYFVFVKTAFDVRKRSYSGRSGCGSEEKKTYQDGRCRSMVYFTWSDGSSIRSLLQKFVRMKFYTHITQLHGRQQIKAKAFESNWNGRVPCRCKWFVSSM